jgi:hypothetical protein
MIFRSENYIEGGVRGFFENFFVADSNQIAVSYCIGSVGQYKKFRPLNPFFAVGAKNRDFLAFCEFL